MQSRNKQGDRPVHGDRPKENKGITRIHHSESIASEATVLPKVIIPPELLLDKWLAKTVTDGYGGTIRELEMVAATLILGQTAILEEIEPPWGFEKPIEDFFYDFAIQSNIDVVEANSLWKQIQQNRKGFKARQKARPLSEIKTWVKKQRELSLKSQSVDGEIDNPVPLLKDYLTVQSKLSGRLRYNTLVKQVELDGETFDLGTAKLNLVVKQRLRVTSSKDEVSDIVKEIAKQRNYSPIVEYLDKVSKEYSSSTSILDGIARRYFGSDNPLHETFLRRFLIAAVARVYEPGCKHDTALILQGKQGYGKSSFFQVLASEPWFDDSLGSTSDKDELLKLHRVWFVEWAELERVLGHKGMSKVKAFLTSRSDLVRPPYARTAELMHRACVIVGTTNQTEFLADTTGNRRFWVIPVTKPIDTKSLKEERDRIWAAAVALYRAGERWHFNHDEESELEEERQQYEMSHPWLSALASYVEGRTEVGTSELLNDCLDIPIANQTRKMEMDASELMTQLGWEKSKHQKMFGGKRQRVWTKL